MIYEKAKSILAQANELESYAQQIHESFSPLKIGFADTIPLICQDLINTLLKLQKDRSYRIVSIVPESNPILAENPFLKFDITLFIGDSTVYSPQNTRVLFSVPYALMVPQNHELNSLSDIYLSDLSGKTIIHPVTLQSFHLKILQEQFHIIFQPMSNVYNAINSAINNDAILLGAAYQFNDRYFKQRKVRDWQFEWDIIVTWKSNTMTASAEKIISSL